jgi:nitroimidazol reductase NimA-like FMN-containing flavoprotein (pyridoxamine 5'-phosphate oxidase superfamily)
MENSLADTGSDTIEQQRMVMTIAELPVDECWRRLAQAPAGRLCFVEAGEPMVLPVNHAVDGHRLVIRTARETTLHRIAVGRSVAYEADALTPVTREGWSVVVRGLIEELTDDDELARARQLGLHPWASGLRDHFLVVQPWAVTGRQIEMRLVDDGGERDG